MLGQLTPNRGQTKASFPAKPAPAGEAKAAPAADSSPVDSLPDLSTIADRAEATKADAELAAKSNDEGSGVWKKIGTAGLLGVAGLGALAATAAPAHAGGVDFGIVITPNGGVGVHIGQNRHGRRHGRHHGHHGNHGHHGGGHGNHGRWGGGHGNHGNHYDQGYNAYGVDGQWHHFDSYGHVNDNSGHYQLETNAWGEIYANYNVYHY